ncbi:MAX gene-associated protein isoform 10-T14 [Alca torda]
MEKQQIVLGSRDGGTVSGAPPAFFVILKQQQGNGKADQGILVANHDACALASSVSTPIKSKVKTCLPADCVSGGITVTLDNNSMWNEFYHRNTEMILTKQGRRMFPYCRYWITGLDASQKYILVMDISPVDNHRYKWNGRWWEPSGKAEPHVLGRVFIHPESPSTGQYWMHQPVSFYKLKLTNNTLDQEGHIILHSMHRYLPRLHLVPADKATEVIQLNGPDVHTFTFPQTEFFAVTAYQNIQITQLKIDYNPFAKGFRDDGLNSRPQRDVKQNSNLELEGGDVLSAASIHGRPAEVDALDLHQRSLDSSFIAQNPSDIDLEKESFNAERDFLRFLDTDLSLGDMPKLKQEVSESPIASSYESSSRVASPLDPNGHFNVVIKEEPVDDYDYESGICTQGISVKQEDTDEETDEYSNTDDDDPILQKHLMRRRETDGIDGEFRSRKRVLTSPSGVAKAKMLKLDSGKMPVVYLEPCAVTKSTVKISELPQTMLSSCKKEKSPLSAILDSLPVCFENHKGSCSGTAAVTEELVMKKQSPGSKMSQKYSSIREAQWALSKSPNFNLRGSVGCNFSAKEICGRKRSGILKNPMSLKSSGSNQNTLSSVTTKRGRPRKLKISKAGRPPKGIGKTVITSKNTSLGPGSILPDVKPDLEDVDGVLFVSFASKEALDIHTVDRPGGEESQNLQAPILTTNDPDCQARIQVLEKELMEELKTLRHKQVIHPSLQEVGLKLNSVDPTMSIDLKYLGVQLPLSYSNFSLWSYPGTNPNSPDTGFPFVSRTGKTNDFTKIKGWRGKLHGASRNEGGSSEGSLKNRSAFCSDKLDEYLENEGKLMETSMGFSSSTPTSPVVYQLPTKSTSYVRTLDSVLKKQSTIIPSTSYTFKPVPLSSTSRKTKTQNRQTSANSRVKSSYKPILPSPFPAKQKQNSGEKAAKSVSNSSLTNQADGFVVPALDENVLPKQISLRQAPQQQQSARPPGLSKSQVKLMDLEDCALWDGKPRTYITEERADISLATLLTAQASLKNKPIHKIIRRRAPPCNNDFCRLGCICASLALEKRQPTHCRRPDCMFGCTCLKRRVLLVKGGSKHKKIMKKAVRGSLVFCGTQEDQQEDEDVEEEDDGEEDELKQKDKKKRKRVEYTICDSEPEQPIRNCPLWVKVEGEIDPEPIYIPTPSVIEPVKSAVLPNPEVLLSSKHRSSSGTKSGRVYTPKPNPVIREEDKDPVYLYFESMMTCARVRAYEHRRQEKKQQKDKSDSQSSSIKEHEPHLQSPEKATCETDKDSDKSGEDATPQATTPPKMSPGTEKRVGPRLLLIPVHQTSPALRPVNNTQLAQRQRMVLQPLRSPGGVNLFRHPNGQIIQLVPLHQFRAAGAQPNVQPVMFRNPGSVVGIRLPAPSKPAESPVSPTSSVSSTSPATNSAVQTAVPKLSPTSNLATQASSLLPSVTSFVSQAGTLTLRISPPAASSVTNQTASESKITCSSGGLPATTANLIPLQSGSFALLQLPGQKTVPNSILHHFASLQMKKDYRKICKKEDLDAAQQKENGKASRSDDVEVTESEVTVSDRKQEENELSVNQSNSLEESASGTVTPDRNSTTLEVVEKDSKVLESSCDDSSSSQHDVSADVISSDHSYISEKPNDEEEKGASEEKEDSVSSETVVEAVSANSETVCGSSDPSVVAPLDNAHPESLENQETAQLKNHGKGQIPAEQEEKAVKEEEGEAQTQMEDSKASSGQSQSQQEQDTQLENTKEQRGTELSQSKQECQDDAMQPDTERSEYKNSTEAESIREKKGSSSEISSAKEQDNASGEKHTVHTEEGKANIARQDGINDKEQDTFDSQEEMKTGHDIVTHVNSSWSKISSIVPALENKSDADNKADTSEKSDFLAPEQRAQEARHHKKGYMPTIDITADDMEEEEEEDDDEDEEDEKTDDSADEMLDGASDFPSEEEVDVEKVDACEYSEDDEQVDIETVEELSEKINIARLKATAANIRPSKQKYHARNSSDEKLSEKPTKQKPQFWKRKLKTEAEAFAHYRQTHTANERRRRNEMRDLFEKLKRTLGLHNLPKVSKCYILKQAYEEIQGLTDQADKLIGQKNLLTRKQDVLIRKVSTLSGKTEEVVLKKLEYIYAKQKAVEAQKKKKQTEPEESVVTSTASTQQEGSSAPAREVAQIPMTNRRGKPLILARKGGRATEDTSSSLTLTAASLVMTPQGQVLRLKSPLVPGQVAAVPSTLLQAELKPRAVSTTMTAQPGIASVMIQLPGSTVPVQVKGILTNSTIPITLSPVAGNAVPSTVVSATEPHSESEDSFMMPKIVNVTSLAAEGSMNLNLNRNKNANTTTAAGAQASEKSLVAAPLESRKSDSILSEEKAKPCPGDSGGDGRNTTGPTKVFFENKDGFPQLRNVSSTEEAPESFSKKLCIGEFVGSQARRKDGDPGGERLKSKELSFRKLQIKDSRIEMELRKVASAMEEAELDASELLSSIEESDDTDETLTSLLNEIAFLNQQLNDDASAMSELPGTLNSDFSHEHAEARRGTDSDRTAADGSSFQFGHLGGSFKDLSEVPEGGGSISPLLLHLEDDDLTDGDKNSGEPSSEADVLKIVIGAEMKDPLPNLSVTSGGNGKTVTTLAETTNVTPPVLQMKTNPEAGNADTLWRPMPKLAPLGLKVASLPVDSEGQSNKVMPLLAPIVAKLAPSGVKTSLPATVQEGQDNKVMPTLAPVVTKLNTTGTLPSNSAGK